LIPAESNIPLYSGTYTDKPNLNCHST